jgi:hypothetical protein
MTTSQHSESQIFIDDNFIDYMRKLVKDFLEIVIIVIEREGWRFSVSSIFSYLKLNMIFEGVKYFIFKIREKIDVEMSPCYS